MKLLIHRLISMVQCTMAIASVSCKKCVQNTLNQKLSAELANLKTPSISPDAWGFSILGVD